jgi:hypothetical protein
MAPSTRAELEEAEPGQVVTQQMNPLLCIDRREGTVAGCGPSNLAAGADGEAGLALKHLPQQADRV